MGGSSLVPAPVWVDEIDLLSDCHDLLEVVKCSKCGIIQSSETALPHESEYLSSDEIVPPGHALKDILLSLLSNIAGNNSMVAEAMQQDGIGFSNESLEGRKLKHLYKVTSSSVDIMQSLYHQVLRSSSAAIADRYEIGYELDKLSKERTGRHLIPELIGRYRNAASYQDCCAMLSGFYYEAIQDSTIFIDVLQHSRVGFLDAFTGLTSRSLFIKRMEDVLKSLLLNKGSIPPAVDYSTLVSDIRSLGMKGA